MITGGCEEGVREHGRQGPAPPRQPAVDLVVVEPGEALDGINNDYHSKLYWLKGHL